MKNSVVKIRRPIYVSPTEEVGSLLSRFKNGKSHMAIVTNNVKQMERNMKDYLDYDHESDTVMGVDAPPGTNKIRKSEVLGIITLEDIIESALKEDILDEADYDNENDVNVNFKMNNSMDAKSVVEENNYVRIHDVLQKKIQQKLDNARKQSEFFRKDSAGSEKFKWLEMNEMSENLLQNNKREVQKKYSSKAMNLNDQIKVLS